MMRTFFMPCVATVPLWAVLVACNDGNTLVRECPLRAYERGDQYQLEYDLVIPSNCPVPIGYEGELKQAGAHIYDYGSSDFKFGGITMWNSDGRAQQEALVEFEDEEFRAPDGSTVILHRAFPLVYYVAATGSRQLDREYDLGYFVATNSSDPKGSPGEPFGDVKITYRQSALANRIAGTSIPYRNTTVTWTAHGIDGYPPYTHDWYRDGQYVGSGDSYTATVSRDFVLQLRTTDATMSVRADVLPVDVDGVLSTLSGPSQIWVSEGGGTWTASATGGTSPHTFTWYIDSNEVGRGPTFTGYNLGQEGYFTLRVDVADAVGARTSAVMEVHQVGTGTGTCDPPPGTDHC